MKYYHLATIISLLFCAIITGCTLEDKELLADYLEESQQIIIDEAEEQFNESKDEIESQFEKYLDEKKEEIAEDANELIDQSKEEISSKVEEASEDAVNEINSAFAGLIGKNFRIPSEGYYGLGYSIPYPSTGIEHTGVDILANYPQSSLWTDNDNRRGNPVYAVYDGNLGRTGSGVEICHPDLDPQEWGDLPDYSVCTYYGHLKDIPERFLNIPYNDCNHLVPVKRGELLGYMDLDADSQLVHLHFSVVKQTDSGCWTNEQIFGNTYDPLIYLQLEEKEYGAEFP